MNNISQSHSIKIEKLRSERFQTLGTLLWSVNKMNQIFCDKATSVVNTRKNLHSSKVRLQEAIDEVQRLEDDLCRQKELLREVTDAMSEALTDLTAPDLHVFNDKEQTILNLCTWTAETEVISAYLGIHDVNRELKLESLIVKDEKDDQLKTSDEITQSHDVDISDASESKSAINVDRTLKCVVCLEGSCNCLLNQCGHICMCFSCAEKLYSKNEKNMECPICKSNIKEIRKVYVC